MRPFLMMAMAAAVSVALSVGASAQTESVIWYFGKASYPCAALTLDTKTGTFYGVAAKAENGSGNGIVFSLVKKRGVWGYLLIYTFGGGNDGSYPYGGLVEDSAGALYGTTVFGGSSGYGTAFKLTFNGSSWVHTVLHSFGGGGADGANPFADLTIDRATGTIYGTTNHGGPQDCGTVFELPPSGGEAMLHAFGGAGEGCGPVARVREDSKGRLYGVTRDGGASGWGMAFRLKESRGVWRESVLHSFSIGHGDGAAPTDLDLDPTTGVLYGTTELGGNCNGTCYGTVFELTKTNSDWQENVLYTFQGQPDGEEPLAIQLDHTMGVLYGTTFYGGLSGNGTVFQLTKNGGSWTETNLHSFGGSGDGKFPAARPTEDTETHYLYGTTISGGPIDGGVAYEIMP